MLTDAEYAFVARELKARTGALMTKEMTATVLNRLLPLARREGFSSVSELLGAARVKADERLLSAVSDALLAADTRFFRDKVLFEKLRTEILPEYFDRRSGAPVRIWTAGCGSGQEAYSLAMMLDDLRNEGMPGAYVLATDLSERVLDKARAGLYTQFEVQRGLPIRKLIQHFEKVGDLWRISDRMRAGVTFEQHNLLQDANLYGEHDIVLCRHVLTGFDPAMRTATLERLAAVMAPDGVLMLGAGETLPDGADAFMPAGAPGLYLRNAAWRKAA